MGRSLVCRAVLRRAAYRARHSSDALAAVHPLLSLDGAVLDPGPGRSIEAAPPPDPVVREQLRRRRRPLHGHVRSSHPVADARRVDADRGLPRVFPPTPFHQWTTDNAYETTHYCRRIRRRRPATSAARSGCTRRSAHCPRPIAIAPDEFALEWPVSSPACRVICDGHPAHILTAVLEGHADVLRSTIEAIPSRDGSPYTSVAGTHNGAGWW